MKFGDYLKIQRETKGWTQPDASTKVGIEQSYLSKLETGKSYPSEEVFTRLVETYEIDISKLADTVTTKELSKLREIGDIRTFLLEQDTKIRRASRGWLLAGLIMLMLGGASTGLYSLGETETVYPRSYVSLGILKPEESIHAFDITRDYYRPDHSDYARHIEMVERIDEVHRIDIAYRGNIFVEKVEGGKRVFETYDSRSISHPSPLRWFAIPAFAFLFGAVGCFFISFRWR